MTAIPAKPPLPDGVILCGGRGSRMDGIDKGLLRFQDTPAVALAAGVLAPLCGRIIISANRNLNAYRDLKLGPVVIDERADFAGPLAGIEAARGHLLSDRFLLLPCDMPLLTVTVPSALLHALDGDAQADAIYASSTGDNHYLVAAIRRRCLAALSDTLDAHERSVRQWFSRLHCKALDFPDADTAEFANFNDSQSWLG